MTQAISPIGAPAVLGESVSAFPGGGFSGGASGFVSDTGGVLVATGAGPGTLLLALTGIVSIVLGLAARATGTRIRVRSTDHAGLPDLSHRSAQLLN